MTRTTIHVLTAALVIAGSATLATALDVSVNIRREVNATSAPGHVTYAWKAAGTRAKGREKLNVLAGSGYLGDFGASFYLTAEPRDGERDPFSFGLFAPTGVGRNTNSTLKCKYDTRKDTSEEGTYNREEASYTFQALDDWVAGKSQGQIIKRKRASTAMDGALTAERVKSKAKIRRRRDAYIGTVSIKTRGTVIVDDVEKPFKASLKLKLRDSREFGGIVDIGDEVTPFGKR